MSNPTNKKYGRTTCKVAILEAELRHAQKLLEAPSKLGWLRGVWGGGSKIAVIVMVFLFIFNGIAYSKTKINIEVEPYTAKTKAGEQLIYALKEEIRKSQGYKLTIDALPRVIIRIVTIDSPSINNIIYVAMIISYNFIDGNWYPIFINHFADNCSTNTVDSIKLGANNLLFRVDETISDYIKNAPK